MNGLVKVNGIVLSASNVGDFDKRVVMLTKERGKVAFFAKGARRMNNPYTAYCQPFAYGEYTLYAAKNYNLQDADVKDYFPEFREDLSKMYRAFYFAELADHFTVEGSPDRDILNLLYMGLVALRKGEMDSRLIEQTFKGRIISLFGMMPEVKTCVNCGEAEEKGKHVLTHFSSKSGGCLCSACANQVPFAIPIGLSTLYSLQHIVSAPLPKLFTFQVNDEVLSELKRVLDDYYKVQVDHEFKTEEFLRIL